MADNKGTFIIRDSCPYVPDYATNGGGGLTMESVKAMLDSIRPKHVVEVGQAYLAAADALTTATNQLHEHAKRIVEAWSGKNAKTALEQLGQLNTTAAELQEKSATTGRTYTWLGGEILPWYQGHAANLDHGFFNDSGDDTAALEFLDRMDHRLVQGYNNVPDHIRKDLPPTPDVFEGPLGRKDPGGINDPWSGPPGGVPSVTPLGGPSGLDPWRGTDPGNPTGTMPNDPGGGIDPAGVGGGPPPGGAGLPGSTDLAGAGGAGLDPFGAGGLGGGAGGAAGGLGGGPGAGGPGIGALGMGMPGSPGTGRSRSSGKNAQGGGGKAGLGGPMGAGGGHGGKDEEERERSTWLTEDDDIWSADGDVTPPVIE